MFIQPEFPAPGESINPTFLMQRQLYIAFLLVFIPFGLSAQEPPEPIRIQYEALTIPEVLQKLQRESDLQFYYLPNWFGDEKVSGSFSDIPPEEFLAELLQDTPVTFYPYSEKTFVLSRNNQIYDALAQWLFRTASGLAPTPGGTGGRRSATNSLACFCKSGGTGFPPRSGGNGTDWKTGSLLQRRNTFMLSGYVRERESGRPIADMVILDKTNGTGTTTDETAIMKSPCRPGSVYRRPDPLERKAPSNK